MTRDAEQVFVVDETSDLPIWAQLRNRMSFLIRTGKYAANQQLPSVRSVAAQSQINYNTVTKAYRSLEDEGLIVNVRGRGMFVADHIQAEDGSTEITDSLLRDCIRKYHALGMGYSDIESHLLSIVQEMRG